MLDVVTRKTDEIVSVGFRVASLGTVSHSLVTLETDSNIYVFALNHFGSSPAQNKNNCEFAICDCKWELVRISTTT